MTETEEVVTAIDGKPITPQEVEGRSIDEDMGISLVAIFGRWYDARRLTIETIERKSDD